MVDTGLPRYRWQTLAAIKFSKTELYRILEQEDESLHAEKEVLCLDEFGKNVQGNINRNEINVNAPINNTGKPMKTKNQYIENLAAELKEWGAQVDILAAKAENAAAHVKLRYVEEVDALRAKQHEAAKKIKELEEASDDAWDTVKDTADRVWDDLKNGLTNASSKFK